MPRGFGRSALAARDRHAGRGPWIWGAVSAPSRLTGARRPVSTITGRMSLDSGPTPRTSPGGLADAPPPQTWVERPELVPVRALAQDGRRSAIEALGSALPRGDALVLTGVDDAFPGAALAPREPRAENTDAGGAG